MYYYIVTETKQPQGITMTNSKILMASDIQRYTHEDYKADQKCKAQEAKQQKIDKWFRANPSVGYLNSGRFYIMEDGKCKEIEALSVVPTKTTGIGLIFRAK
mgnify:FL=1|tara:strand:- start:113 stop:418 length:306 start_codon:yes stop_codon:yes gene_type:complete